MLNFLFDLDDTLLATWDVFDVAENRFFEELAKLGFDRELAKNKFVEIDNKNVAKWGFMPKRFYTSMGETYITLCENSKKIIPDMQTQQMLEDIGRSVFITPPPLFDGAIDVLETLKNFGAYLFLWTKGDYKVQTQKVEKYNLNKFFGKIYILENKNRDVLAKIISENQLVLKDTWIVGDSIRSEINPALELGINAIWYSGKSWRYEEAEPIHQNFKTVSNLREIIAIYPELVKISQSRQ